MQMDGEEVIREIDVYITEDLNLFLTQFPLKPVYSDPIEVESAIFKPNHKKLELTVPYSNGILQSFENHRGPKSQKYTSSTVAQNMCLGAGVISNNALHITPINSVLQMRPSFKNMQSRGEIIEDMNDLDDEAANDSDGGDGLEHVQLKRKESERSQSTRAQSYSYLQSQEEAEGWYSLKVHDIGSEESDNKFIEMCHKDSQVITFKKEKGTTDNNEDEEVEMEFE